MTDTTLAVLLVESHPHRGDLAAEVLARAGHQVHRCAEPPGDAYRCRGMDRPSTCPIDVGPIDVAVISRGTSAVRPTRFEQGVRCSVRAGIPLVEESRSLFDPYVDLGAHAVDDVVALPAACERAVAAARGPLVDAIRSRIERLLLASSIEPSTVGVEIERKGRAVEVVLTTPVAAPQALRHALSVRVLDAVRAGAQPTLGDVGVHVRTGPPARENGTLVPMAAIGPDRTLGA